MEKGIEKGIEQGLAEGLEKGKVEGRAEGILEGEAKGKAKALLELLKIRFGDQPEAIHAQIMAMHEMQTSACMKVIFEAASVAEVLQQAEDG